MLFNSFQFLIFFVAITIGYYCLPHKIRWVLLLAGSYYFYMCWRKELILLIVFSTFVNYSIALAIDRSVGKKRKKNYLIISLIINFGLLFLFKYSVFFNEILMDVMGAIGGMYYRLQGYDKMLVAQKVEAMIGAYPYKEFSIILPMGISFYTFQAASYTIDVYKGEVRPVRHYGIFSLFITFFPQLVAGPIERSKNLLPQFFTPHAFSKERLLSGVKLMILGFFKKVVIADRIAVGVNTIYNAPGDFSGLSLLLATLFFTFQIYCDFSGYSDIATGSARVLGFDLMMNFHKPYLSKSIKEFWRRWHISLSTWFMDYVYIPLGGNRRGRFRTMANLLTTFLVSGLWHGANWTFIFWGGFHGVYLVVGNLLAPFKLWKKEKLPYFIGWIVTVCSVVTTFVLVSIGWIFFRANTLGDAFYILANLTKDFTQWTSPQYVYDVMTSTGLNLYELKILCVAIVTLMGAELISGTKSVFAFWEDMPYFLGLGFYSFVSILILTTGVFTSGGAFIYFQF